jgi:hypothetical protein
MPSPTSLNSQAGCRFIFAEIGLNLTLFGPAMMAPLPPAFIVLFSTASLSLHRSHR